MSLEKNNFYNISIYLLPLASFFILISPALTNVFILLSVFSSIILIIIKKDIEELLDEKIFICCFLLYGILLLSYIYTIAEFDEYFEVIKKYIKFLYIPFLFYLTKKLNNSENIIRHFISGCTIILFLSYCKYFSLINYESLYSLLENLNIANVKDKVINNNTSVFQDYIIQGIVFSFYSFICLIFALRNQNLIYLILSFLAFFNVLFMNDSRTAYILIAALLAFSLSMVIKNNKIRLSIVIVFISIFFTQFSDNLEFRIKTLHSDLSHMENNNYNSSLGLRYIWTKVGLDNLKNSPIIGNGAGSFEKSSLIYFEKNKVNLYSLYLTNNPHNEFISLSSQLGTIGFFLYFLFIYYLFNHSQKNIFSYGLALTVLISSVFNSAFYDNMLGLFLIIIISALYQNNIKFLKK